MALTPEQRTPPEGAKNNAKKAIRWRKEHPKETRGAGTAVGWTRARQLANGGPLSEDTIKRMAQFNRHRSNAEVDPKYKSEPWRDKGYLMWLAWGGTTGINWAIKRTEMMKDKGMPNPFDVLSTTLSIMAAPDGLKTGDFASWNSSGGKSQGKIDRIVRDGKIDVPDSSFTITGTADDPAALITVYKKVDGGYEATSRKVGHKFSTLTKIKPLSKPKQAETGMETKYLKVPFAIKQMDENDSDFYTFEGYASTFGNVDLGDDRIMQGAFKETIRECMATGNMPRVLWQHDMAMPLGTYVDMREDEKGLYVKGRMPKGDDFVRGRVFPQMKAGSITAMSIGYMAEDYDIEGDVRNLKKIKLFEISLVTMPMNPQAQITGMKAVVPFQDLPLADEGRSWDKTAAIGRVRDFLDSEDEPSSKYRRAFLWYDRENTEDFGAYKMPIADVIDGKLTAVPRAIFAAAAAVQGARGGLNIPDTDKAKVRSHIERYYKKMDRDSPFKSATCLRLDSDILSTLTEREIDSVLRNGVLVTRKAAKQIISCLDTKALRDAGTGAARDAENGTTDGWKNILQQLKTI